jgi:hypothetical protein
MRKINKKVSLLLTIFCLSVLTGIGFSSCAKKIGCPANEQAHGKKSKKVKPGTSNLFSKKMRKN